MKIKKAQLILLLAAAFQLTANFIANAQVNKTPNGILVKVGNHQVGLSVKNSAFCLSLNNAAAPASIKSVFIDESNKSTANYTVVSGPSVYGIKTSFGKLLVNTVTQAWSLYDVAGHVLVRDGAFSFTDTSVTITHTATGLLYGSGNQSSKELEKEHSKSAVGNGTTGIPYFWNNAGYSAFAVSTNDNKPATWDRAADKKTLTWKFAGKAANLYLWPAPTMKDGASGYVKLTGKPKLPPK